MSTVNSMRVSTLKTMSELQMSVQRVTPTVNGIPCEDEICFVISGYCEAHEIEIDEHVLLLISEAKRLIGILEVITMNEKDHLGVKA